MLNSNYGISITNLPGLLIQQNTFTNTACALFLSNVTDAQVIGNTIISNREEMAGIYCQSSGVTARNNDISGHTVGLHFANSPTVVLGSNRITSNKIHGIYAGSGSALYMRKGQFIGSPPNFYATSGYNKIFDNGGYMGAGIDNDGSEIYFYSSTATMDSCNSIYDDRTASPPLVNTLLLMNGYRFGFPALQAQYNFWGDTVYAARFGSLSVNYIPYESRALPWEPLGGEDELF
jgi:hypothetical protein